MGDLTDEEIEWRLTHTMSTSESEFRAVLLELKRRRAAQSASSERVRSVVREATVAFLDERKLYIVRPEKPSMNDIVLEAFGHGRACDAVALRGDDLQVVLTDLADRVASQLAVPVLSAEEREQLELVRNELIYTPGRHSQVVVLDRLLGVTGRPKP